MKSLGLLLDYSSTNKCRREEETCFSIARRVRPSEQSDVIHNSGSFTGYLPYLFFRHVAECSVTGSTAARTAREACVLLAIVAL